MCHCEKSQVLKFPTKYGLLPLDCRPVFCAAEVPATDPSNNTRNANGMSRRLMGGLQTVDVAAQGGASLERVEELGRRTLAHPSDPWAG